MNIIIGSGVESIGDRAFAYNDRTLGTITIGSADLPTSLTGIAAGAFSTNSGRTYKSLTVYCSDAEHYMQIETIINNANIPVDSISYIWPGGEDIDPPHET